MESVVEIAQKQRQLHLLVKVKNNKPLSMAELKELENYENNMAIKPEQITKVIKQKKTRQKKAGQKSRFKRGEKQIRRKHRPLGASRIKLLALNYPDMTAAEAAAAEMFGFDEPLAEYLKKNKDLAAAWERGRFLRHLKELASTAVTISEAENTLELQPGQLKKMIETDPEIAELWNGERLAVIVALKKAMVEKAKEGKLNAIKQIEYLLRNEIAGREQIDFKRVTITQLCELTGRTRQSVHDWYTKHGLNRNSDKTFDLYDFIPWYANFIITKKADAPGRPAAGRIDPLRDVRAQNLQLDLEHKRGQLLDRQQVIAGLLARSQTLINSLDRKAEDLAALCNNRPMVKIIEILDNFFDDVRRQQCTVPEFLNLPEKAKEKYEELMELISG